MQLYCWGTQGQRQYQTSRRLAWNDEHCHGRLWKPPEHNSKQLAPLINQICCLRQSSAKNLIEACYCRRCQWRLISMLWHVCHSGYRCIMEMSYYSYVLAAVDISYAHTPSGLKHKPAPRERWFTVYETLSRASDCSTPCRFTRRHEPDPLAIYTIALLQNALSVQREADVRLSPFYLQVKIFSPFYLHARYKKTVLSQKRN